jgi:hypothetical protein
MKYFFILLLLPIKLFAQDISGVWIGYLYNDTTKQNIHYELAISEFKGKPTGYSHTTFVIDSIENIGVKSVNIKEKNGHFYIVDDKLIFDNYTEPPAKGVKQFSFLSLSENGHAQILSGVWRTNATREYRPLTGSIYLEKRKVPEETLIVTKLAQLNLLDKLSFLTPSDAARIFALNKKPVLPPKIPSLTAQAPEPNDAAINIREEVKPVKQPPKPIEEEKAVAIVERKIEKSAIATSASQRPKPPVPVVEKEQPITTVATETKPVIQAPPPPPKPAVVTEQKKIEKPLVTQQPKTVVVQQPKQEEKKIEKPTAVQQPKQEEKKITVKETPAPTQEKNQVAVAPQAPPEPAKKPTGPPAAIEIAKRSLETIRIVEIARDSLVFSLYDNGAVDGDTVSVLLNGQVIMPRVGLLERATNKTIYLTPDMGDSVSVIMYAENLGSIPPNTGLLVIREGEKIYEIRFSGDLNKNSKIILIRKKEN